MPDGQIQIGSAGIRIDFNQTGTIRAQVEIVAHEDAGFAGQRQPRSKAHLLLEPGQRNHRFDGLDCLRHLSEPAP